MSEETFEILRNLNMNEAETQAACQCAPLLAELKLSNLLRIRTEQKDEVFQLFGGTSISCRILLEWSGMTTMLAYRERRLIDYLNSEHVRSILDELGYQGRNLDEMFELLSVRYQAHVERKDPFPHEIGLLLGYPPEDVAGFIEHEGRDFLYSGYWKVYGDAERMKQIFAAYDRAREMVIRMVGKGMGVKGIMAYYHCR